MADLLELRSISSGYGQFQVHDNLNITVPAGCIVSVLGGNASGKSTTIRLILGLLLPRTGSILWEGRDITALTTPHRIKLGMASVPEARRVFQQMTVQENLLVGGFTCTDAAELSLRLDRIFKRFSRLYERRRQAAGTLSGGEQQMLALGRALMSNPRLICIDEPTMGLSPRLVDEVLVMLRQLCDQDSTAIVMVEQNAHLALQIADYGYVLQSGRLVLQGQAAELRRNSAITEAYLGTGIMPPPR